MKPVVEKNGNGWSFAHSAVTGITTGTSHAAQVFINEALNVCCFSIIAAHHLNVVFPLANIMRQIWQ